MLLFICEYRNSVCCWKIQNDFIVTKIHCIIVDYKNRLHKSNYSGTKICLALMLQMEKDRKITKMCLSALNKMNFIMINKITNKRFKRKINVK